MIFKNEKEAKKALKKWRKILRLQEWNIDIHIVRASEIDDGTTGEIQYNYSIKKAIILLLDPIDYVINADFEQDMESILVHELLHLSMHLFEPDMKDECRHDVWHSTLNTIAEALVEASRKR